MRGEMGVLEAVVCVPNVAEGSRQPITPAGNGGVTPQVVVEVEKEYWVVLTANTLFLLKTLKASRINWSFTDSRSRRSLVMRGSRLTFRGR